MRTDRAGNQASRCTQGGTSYPTDNSQVMPAVIEIILPLELFNHWQSHMQGDKIEERTSLITSATLNCLPYPDCHSSHQHLWFLFCFYYPAHVKIFLKWSIDGQTLSTISCLCGPFYGQSLGCTSSFSSLWLNSNWDTSVAPARIDHQMDKAQSH